jgi:hypothetical protein
LAFSIITPICFFLFFCSFPSIALVPWDQGTSIDWSKILDVQRYVFLTQKEHVGFFQSCVSLFFLSFWCVTLILHYQTSSLFLSISILSFFLMQFELTLKWDIVQMESWEG